MSKLINITAPPYRCTVGACPAVFKSEDGETLRITGRLVKQVDPIPDSDNQYEADVDISANLVLESLGVNELVEAVDVIIQARGRLVRPSDKEWLALRIACDRVKGEK